LLYYLGSKNLHIKSTLPHILYKFLSTASPALNTRQLYIHINNGQGVFTITVTIFSYCFTGPVFQTRSTPIHARTADKTIRNFYFPSLCLSLSPPILTVIFQVDLG